MYRAFQISERIFSALDIRPAGAGFLENAGWNYFVFTKTFDDHHVQGLSDQGTGCVAGEMSSMVHPPSRKPLAM